MKVFLLFLFLVSYTSALNKCLSGSFGLFGTNNPDYIIVGGGAAGSVALSKCIAKGYRCTLIEKGNDYTDPSVILPSTTGITQLTTATTMSQSEPLTHMYDKVVHIAEPNIIGGSTSINGMISTMTDIVNLYEEYDIPGWSYAEMLPYYINVTKSSNRPGSNGPVDVTHSSVNDPRYVAFKSAIQQVLPNIVEKLPDMNTASITSGFPGFGPPEYTIKTTQLPLGKIVVRESAYTAYVEPIRYHPNARIMLRSRVDKIIFNADGTKAKKVYLTYFEINLLGIEIKLQCELAANKGIILAAGALRTPQILMLSGVGPIDHLQSKGITVVKNHPNVGSNLDDHPSIARAYIGSLPDSLSDVNVNGHAYWNYQDDPSLIPNWSLQIQAILPTELLPLGVKMAVSELFNQTSRGSIRLKTSNPDDQPAIDLGYFSDPNDIVMAAQGFNITNLIVQLLNYIQIPPINLNNIALGSIVTCPSFLPDCQDDIVDFYKAAYLTYALPGYHFTGTCSFNKVVNPDNGKVYGFDNLYVVDASVFPKAPRGNTQISVYAAATKLSDSIF